MNRNLETSSWICTRSLLSEYEARPRSTKKPNSDRTLESSGKTQPKMQRLISFTAAYLLLLSPTVCSPRNGAMAEEQGDCTALECFEEWRAEEGYWIGEYSFYQADATPFTSETWNYPYQSYKGFVTAAVNCNKFRQRNVFLYPPQSATVCMATNHSVVGDGTCGVNGNSKVFFADQEQDPIGQANNDGTVEGTYAGGLYATKTTLVGDGTAVLYQVLDANTKKLHMNQLTSITTSEEDGLRRRIRSAQAFTSQGHPMAMSYFREREVGPEEFLAELAATLTDYNILSSDTCAWMDYGPKRTKYTPGMNGCIEHLLEAF